MLSKIDEIKARIQLRSQLTRSKYLEEVDEWKKKSPNRNSLGCSNIAHAFAACDKNRQNSDLNSKKFVGIITAYNDMLSAHAPFESYPRMLKEEGNKLNLNIQVAGGFLQCVMGLHKESQEWSFHYSAEIPLHCLQQLVYRTMFLMQLYVWVLATKLFQGF